MLKLLVALYALVLLACIPRDREASVCTTTAPLAAPVIETDCARGVEVEALTACLATAVGPDACVAAVAGRLCDTDGDGVADDLESALARAYAPAFAFGGVAAPETHFPANVQHFLSRAQLRRRDGAVVEAQPTLASLGAYGNDPCGDGPNLWLCLRDSAEDTRVTSAATMRALPNGVDVVSVVHPAERTLASSTHLFVSFSLLFPYNAHSAIGNHEGDWEGIAVFVNRRSGAVDAAWFERHDTTDNTRFVDASVIHDPAAPAAEGAHGLRFFDPARRHVVAYVAAGGHAMYDYPGTTRILRLGPRDAHVGDGPKLLPWLGRLAAAFGSDAGEALPVTFHNPGEANQITLPWARFRGQWGCNDGVVGKSWPGPFGNMRHPRPMFERAWGLSDPSSAALPEQE